MNNNNVDIVQNDETVAKPSKDEPSELNNMDSLSQYLKATVGKREGRAIPPLDQWHPENVADMDLVIKANGEAIFIGSGTLTQPKYGSITYFVAE